MCLFHYKIQIKLKIIFVDWKTIYEKSKNGLRPVILSISKNYHTRAPHPWSSLSHSQCDADEFYEAVLKTEGFEEEMLATAFDYLVQEQVGLVFHQKWLLDFMVMYLGTMFSVLVGF